MKIQSPVHPGEILRLEFLEPLSMTADILSERLSIPTDEVNALLECRISLTAEIAMKLHEMFGTSSEFWMKLQSNYDMCLVGFDDALANNCVEQLQLITDAYADADEAAIDAALTHITMVRRMKSKGIFDVLETEPDVNTETTSGPSKMPLNGPS